MTPRGESAKTPSRRVVARAHALLRAATVWDNHGCMPLKPEPTFLPQLERYRLAGFNVASINIGMARQSSTQHMQVLSFMRHWIAQRPLSFQLISTVADISRCKAERKLGVVFDVEGMCPVLEDTSLVQTFYDLGVRWMLVAYNLNNAAGGGCLDIDAGLTDAGRAIIDEMERVGMVLCLSHCGPRTAAEALEYSRNPPIFSHSNPYGDVPNERNVSDSLMQACARKGGVVGLTGFGAFLGADCDRLIDRLLHQLHYVIDRIGADHVGLGLDYVFDSDEFLSEVRGNPTLYPANLLRSGATRMIQPEQIMEIAEGLAATNLSDSQIGGILGNNWLRVARQVWR